MRRAEREIKDPAGIEAVMAKGQIMRVAFYDAGEIYIVPVNYGYVQKDGAYTLYFHGACAGRKYEISRSDPKVGFELEADYHLMTGEIACKYSAGYQSIVGTGRLCLAEDPEEKKLGLNAVMRQTTGKDAWEYDDAMLRSVAVFRLDVEQLSCKAH